MDVQDFTRRKREVEEKTQKVARDTGALEQLLKQAADEFGSESYTKFKEHVAKSLKKLNERTSLYEKSRRCWEEEFGDMVG